MWTTELICHSRRKVAYLNWRRKMGRLKAVRAGFYRMGTREEWAQQLFRDHQSCPLSFKMGPLPCFQQARWPLAKAVGQSHLELWEHNPCQTEMWRQDHHPVWLECRTFPQWGLEDTASSQGRLFLSHKIVWRLSYSLDFLETCYSFFFPSFLLEWKCPPYACPTTVLWKNITCLVS